MIFEFKEYDGVNQTPAIPLIARAWPEIIAAGNGGNEGVHGWDHQAIVCFAGDMPVGVMTFTHEKWRKLVWVHLGYVVPEMRRQGIYRLMWERVVKAAQKCGAAEIQGGTHVDNKAMLECAESLGRTRLFITTRFVVPPVAAVPTRAEPAKKRAKMK
jgi:GNAT superfamily N-acetyltransferase